MGTKKTKQEETKPIEIKKIDNNTLIKYLCFTLFGVSIGLLLSLLIKKDFSRISGSDEKYNSLYETYSILKDNYYKDVDDDTLVDGAINGMMESLDDPHSNFFTKSEKESFEAQLSGEYYGIGAEIIQVSKEEVRISKLFKDSPAQKSGLKVGDIFLSIDNESCIGLTSEQIASNLRSNNKNKSTIVVKRNDEELTFEVEKDNITIDSVSYEMLEDNIGYITLDIFGDLTYNQFTDAVDSLEEEGMKSLIIDLRGNGGGYLTSVTKIISDFLGTDKIIYKMKYRDKVQDFYSTTTKIRDYKVVILIDEGSASASEIMASCLQEQYGAVLVGKKSYGKGSVQETTELANGSLIKYTVQEWLTSKGNSINGVGINPDVEVELSEDFINDPVRENDNQLQKAIEVIKE